MTLKSDELASGTEVTLSGAVRAAAKHLAENGVDNAEYDSFALMSAVNGMDRTYYLMHGGEPVKEADYNKFAEYVKRRADREPLQHILGKAYFFGYEFKVNSDVLVPRPDTEILVEEALKVVENGSTVLDMCTGSGCIILTLALQRNLKRGIGVDISKKALAVAMENAESLSVENVDFIESNLFENVEKCPGTEALADVIVSNPPYIPTAVITGLSDEVRLHDPMLALDGHDDGLYFYRRITSQAGKYLKKGGFLLYEIGHDQSEQVEMLMREAGFEDICTVKDLAGLDRVVKGRLR